MSFASDSFTGTDDTVLETYSASWTKVTGGAGGDLKINTNRLNAAASTGWQMHTWNAGQAATADYDVQATFTVVNVANVSCGIAGRIVSGSNNDAYFVDWHANDWDLWKRSGGTATALGTYAGDAPTTPRVVTLSMVGSTISVLVDGVERISVTDTALAAKGYAGTGQYYADNSTLRYIDDWSATDAVTVITGTGVLSAQAADVTGAGISASLATEGDISAQAAAASGDGASGSAGAGVPAAQSAAVAGEGVSASLATEGAIAAQSAGAAGSGLSSSASTDGTIAAQAAAVSGAGASASLATDGAIAAQAAAVDGSGLSESLATEGAIVAQSAGASGAGTVGTEAITGAGALMAQAADAAGEAQSGSEGAGVLAAGAASAAGVGQVGEEQPGVPALLGGGGRAIIRPHAAWAAWRKPRWIGSPRPEPEWVRAITPPDADETLAIALLLAA